MIPGPIMEVVRLAKFKKITFKGLISQFKNRFRMIPVSSGANLYDMYPERGTVTQQGDEITAEGMNQLQENIADAFAAVYDSDVSDGRYAPAITGQLEGERVYADDAAAGGDIQKLIVKGECRDLTDGEKAPNNPHNITSLSPTRIFVEGKNILDINAIMQSAINSGGTAERVTFAREDAVKIIRGTNPLGNAIPLNCVPGAYTFTYRYYIDSADTVGHYYNISYTDGSIKYVEPKKFKAWDTVTVTTDPDKTVSGLKVVLQTRTVTQYVGVSSQIERGTSATSYEPYPGAVYILPSLGLYGVANAVEKRDTYDVIAGKTTKRIGVMELSGTENVTKLDANCNAESNLYYITGVYLTGGSLDILCTHLPTVSMVSATSTENGIIANSESNMFYFRIRLDTGITSVAEVKSWMAAQKAAGTPVKVYYIKRDVTETQETPQYVNQPSSSITLVTGAPMDVTYVKDTNMVINNLTNRLETMSTAMAMLLGGE